MAQRKKDNTKDYTKQHGVWLKWLWRLFGLGLLVLALIIFMVSLQDLPTFDELENPDIELASSILADDGTELGRYYTENRVPVAYEDLNPKLVDALIATEDIRYYKHSGIDFRALGRVAAKTLILQKRSSGGGSTITQQLAKQLFPRQRLSSNKIKRTIQIINIKLKEWITAVKLERSYTKEEMIAMLLNKFDFIHGAQGVHSASETYFGKNQKELDVEEAAMLIGMLKNPALYNPKSFPTRAKSRRDVVLNQMQKADMLSKSEYEMLVEKPLDVSKFKRTTHIDGLAPYMRAELAKDLKNLLSRPEFYKADGTEYNIYRDGLKIYTTIDRDMQKIAEDVMEWHMSIQQERFFGEWKNRDPWTYRDNKIPVDLKKESLESLVARSDRYQNKRAQMLGDEIRAIEKKFDLTLRDVDIARIQAEEEKRGSITRMVASKIVPSSLADNYRKIIESDEWRALMTKWPAFEKAIDSEFNTPVKMTVFAYNSAGEVDTLMSPLDSIKYHRMHLQTGVCIINPNNGHIKTWIGGVGHKFFKYDHVRTDRQVGSTFKPFVYASAISFKGISPCTKVEDIPYTIMPGEGSFELLKEWTPKNATGKYDRTKIPLYDCLKRSKNTASVYLMKQLGSTNAVRGLVHNMGIDSSTTRSDGSFRLPNAPSICLGSADLSVLEMTGAYATFANDGVYNKPTLINRIEDRNGKVIYQSIPNEQVVLDPKANYVMVDMLRYATRGVPGFQEVESEYGGKTGTTNDHTDGWFMGITPNLVVGVWVGGEDRWIRYLNFSNGQGSRMARPYFSEFLRRLEDSEEVDYDPTARFERPAEDLGIVIDCDKYRQFESPRDSLLEINNDFFQQDF